MALAAVFAAACVSDGGPATGDGMLTPAGDAGEGDPTSPRSYAGSTPAPDFPTGLTWFNVQRPLTIADLQGKAVLLDFWTQGCINCQHIIPDLHRLEAEFGDQLAVIGVHSGKYEEEKDDDTIRESILRNDIVHPVVNDRDFAIWQTYGVRAWPTMVLIDPEGQVVGFHAGEGAYAVFQPLLTGIFEEFSDRIDPTPLPLAPEGATVAATVLNYPAAVLIDGAGGRMFIADSGNNRILVASLAGELQAVIGSGAEGFADGTFADATFRDPQGFDISPDGRLLYVADTRNHAVREVNLETREVRTLAGTGQRLQRLPLGPVPGREAELASPWDVLVVNTTLYISNAGSHQIFALDLLSETVQPYVGSGREGLDGGPRTMASLAQPSGLTRLDHNIYWVDPEGSAVREFDPETGNVRNLIGTGLFDFGFADGVSRDALLQHPQGIVAAGGALYIADTYNHAIRRLDPVSLELTTIAGTDDRGWADGSGADARFNEPAGIDTHDGKLYVADTSNHLIRTIDLADGSVSTLTLTNLAVALGESGPGNTLTVELPRQEVAPGAGFLRITVDTPDAYHLNSQAPSRLSLASSNGAVVELSEAELSWASDEASVELPVGAQLAGGEAVLTVEGTAFYCRDGEEALCFIQAVQFVVPVTVREGATSGDIELAITLPEA